MPGDDEVGPFASEPVPGSPGVVVNVVIAAESGHGLDVLVIVEAPAVAAAQDRSLAAFADAEVSRVRRPDVCAGRESWPEPLWGRQFECSPGAR